MTKSGCCFEHVQNVDFGTTNKTGKWLMERTFMVAKETCPYRFDTVEILGN